MAIRDEIRKERKAFLKDATFKQKIGYILEYYRLHIIIGLIIIIVVSSLIYHKITDPDIVLNGIFINLYDMDRKVTPDDVGDNFLKSLNLDTGRNAVSFGTGLSLIKGDDMNNYQSSQALMVQCAAGSVDFVICQNDVLVDYAYGGLFTDLRETLTEDELEKYAPYLCYIDGAVVKKQEEDLDDNSNEPAEKVYPDSRKPEEMEDPIPIFIGLDKSKIMSDVYGAYGNDLVFAMAVNAPNKKNAVAFLKYIL